jgi:hypothetical protein
MSLVEPILGTKEIGWSPISHVRAKASPAPSQREGEGGRC